MASLQKRRTVIKGRGGAGPFHKQGRGPLAAIVADQGRALPGRKPAQPDELARLRTKREQRSVFHRTLGKLTGRAGA